MRFGCEKRMRRACNEDWTVILTEYYNEKANKTYCRLHVDFADGNCLHEPFEELCKKYHVSEEFGTDEYGRRKNTPKKSLTVEQGEVARVWWRTFECPTEDDLLEMMTKVINMEEK